MITTIGKVCESMGTTFAVGSPLLTEVSSIATAALLVSGLSSTFPIFTVPKAFSFIDCRRGGDCKAERAFHIGATTFDKKMEDDDDDDNSTRPPTTPSTYGFLGSRRHFFEGSSLTKHTFLLAILHRFAILDVRAGQKNESSESSHRIVVIDDDVISSPCNHKAASHSNDRSYS